MFNDADEIRALFCGLIGKKVDERFILIAPFHIVGGDEIRAWRHDRASRIHCSMRVQIAALGVLLLLTSYAARAGDVAIVSGSYDDGMLIGFDQATQVVTGYFREETGEGQFSCIFYLMGKSRGSETTISTYFPETPTQDLIKGQLTPGKPGQFQVRLSSEHGGCWNVQHFADKDQPAQFTLNAAYPWRSVAVVKRDKAYFFDTPTSSTHRKGYLVKGDGVGVRAVQPGWLQVDFIGGGKPVSGWIRQADVYPTP